MKLHFYKYQGTGNDFVIIDDRLATFPIHDSALVAKLCDRKFGIGADGLILLQKSDAANFYMKYYNSDGNESSMCGNGGRCIAAFAYHLNVAQNETTFIAIDGAHDAHISQNEKEWYVKLKMQDVTHVELRDEHTFVLNTGSPHFVRFLQKNIDELNIVDAAKSIRYNDEFKQEGINVNFANVSDLKTISIRTYERGVEDETLSCGTGVTAAALSTAILNNLPGGIHTIDVKVKGGALSVKFNYNKQQLSFTDIWLQGSATFVFEGDVEV